jgi:hypothetical protein
MMKNGVYLGTGADNILNEFNLHAVSVPRAGARPKISAPAVIKARQTLTQRDNLTRFAAHGFFGKQ